MDTFEQGIKNLKEGLKKLEEAFLEFPVETESEKNEVESCLRMIRTSLKDAGEELEE